MLTLPACERFCQRTQLRPERVAQAIGLAAGGQAALNRSQFVLVLRLLAREQAWVAAEDGAHYTLGQHALADVQTRAAPLVKLAGVKHPTSLAGWNAYVSSHTA